MLKTVLFLFLAVSLQAQNYAGTWLLGFDSTTGLPEYGGSTLSFQEDSLLVYGESRGLNFQETVTSMSDSLGNLQFYTNGVAVVNTAGDTLENGDNLTPSLYSDVYAQLGWAKPQTTLALPDPGDTTDTRYYLFHHRPAADSGDVAFVMSRVDYNLIDMTEGGGSGAVVSKNQLAIQDTFAFLEPRISAVRHGNGRDWWVMVPSDTAALYHQVLVSPEGIGAQQTQDAGFYQLGIDFNQNVFSPDGRYFIDHDFSQGTRIFDYDRCTGELSNMRHIFQTNNHIAYATGGGAAVSANSRYLYISAKRRIYQFDLTAENIAGSRIEVVELPEEGFQSPYTPYFYQMQLGIDGRIYINSLSGVDVLHVIESPDLPGVACNVNINAVKLPHWNFRSLPTFPNYRLYDLADSPCDTLGINRVYTDTEDLALRPAVRLFPNPTDAALTIELPTDPRRYLLTEIVDITGKTVLQMQTTGPTDRVFLDTSRLPAGIYFVRLHTETEVYAGQRLVIARNK